MAPNVTLKSIGLYKKKISTGSLAEIDKLILKFKWKYKRHRRGKAMLRKGDKIRGLTLSDFTTYYKAAALNCVVQAEG